MSQVAVRKVRDLDETARAWLTRLFGEAVADDTEVRVELLPPASPSAELRRVMDGMTESLRRVPDDEMEAALDEAMKAARPRYQR